MKTNSKLHWPPCLGLSLRSGMDIPMVQNRSLGLYLIQRSLIRIHILLVHMYLLQETKTNLLVLPLVS